MQATAGIGGTRATGDKTYAGPASQLAIGFGHVSRAAFVTADDQRNFAAIIKCVQCGQKAFPGDAKDALNRVDFKRVDEDFGAAAGISLCCQNGPGY